MPEVRAVQFVPTLCPACAELALTILVGGMLLRELCSECRAKISAAAEAFVAAVAAEMASESNRTALAPKKRARGARRRR